MFNSENELQDLVDGNPYIITDALIEISPTLNGTAVPQLFSLGREIPLSSGPLDNLYIDAHGILTIVECKLYSNAEIKRKVYSQVINYTADIQADLRNYTNRPDNEEFSEAFQSTLIESAQDPKYKDFQEMVEDLSSDPYLARYNKNDWETQFKIRLEQNIKSGIFRVIIACGEKSDQTFHLSNVRNLMKIMQFSENKSNLYDISLIDIRKVDESTVSKVIWRRYSELPMVPLIATSIRNTTAKVENVHSVVETWQQSVQELYKSMLNLLPSNGLTAKENTHGLSFYSQKSLFTQAVFTEQGFFIRRVQIGYKENLWTAIENNTINETFPGFTVQTKTEKSTISDTGYKYHVLLKLTEHTQATDVIAAIHNLNDWYYKG